MPQTSYPTPFVPPTRNDWDTLFQPLFDEYFCPLPCIDHPVPEVAAPEPVVSTSTPSSTTIDQDAPSLSTSQTPQESPSQVIPPGVEEADHDIKVAHIDNNHYFSLPIPEPSSEESSSQVVIPNNVHSINQPPEHISKCTKDHPIDNVIHDPSRPVSTRHQLQNKALICYFDAFLSFVEPKSYKEALTEYCWIEAMQEELNEFERLKVWELTILAFPRVLDDMETSRLVSLHEPNLCGTQLVIVVVIDKSSGNISIKSRTTEISLNLDFFPEGRFLSFELVGSLAEGTGTAGSTVDVPTST
ncbi:hypothetical protein Tco_0863911 [Tanacetum coccineum]